MITNLMSNAIKFTPEGGKISVSATRREATQQYPEGAIEISVIDNGPGISPEHVQKIFDKFERGRATTGTSGTGLGLSISREIVKLHGGEIWLESKLNEGSKFSFLLPRYTHHKFSLFSHF